MRLIDADALKEEFAKHEDRKGYLIGDWEEIIDNAPTVDITFKEVVAYECGQKSVERPQGEWLHPYVTDIACECSICHVQMPTYRFNFCPNCGAEMGKEAENDN